MLTKLKKAIDYKELTEQKGHFETALKVMKKWNGEGDCKYCKNVERAARSRNGV